MRFLVRVALCVALAFACVRPAAAATIILPTPTAAVSTLAGFAYSASGTIDRPSHGTVLPVVAGQSVCVLVLSGASSFSLQPETMTGGAWDFSSAFGTISAPGTYVGIIDYTRVTAFSFVVTSVGQTPISYTETCGPPWVAITVQQ